MVALPATALADRTCQEGALNLVALGAFAVLFPPVPLGTLESVTRERSGKKPEWLETNLEALAQGAAWARENAR